jgi:hypothetical protein
MTDFGKLDLCNERTMSDIWTKFYSPFECSLTDSDIVLLECNSLFYSNKLLRKHTWFGIRLHLAYVYQLPMIAWQDTSEGSTTSSTYDGSYKFYTCHWEKSRDRTQKLCGLFCIPDLFDDLDTPVLTDFMLQFFTFIVVDLHANYWITRVTTERLLLLLLLLLL